ncbi:PrsW family intramembrane metalloprotease [Halolamina salifodinae]|uniref:RsiW-degrading membrane proteinase PrsW (M82 family) n=1 Tax=Halolamina salifodinae TaxID=1202767 RepID=A0A8T4GV88_9EURY|nr:PrsW family intramembrane metalloprotease [Halolamina salifodinae]MBP1987041.1 RsiW-degrading membrane proteinase PrsW (M82 family) [Halolamina salifodinae]
MTDTDPVEEASVEDRDLYDVATWEPRTTLDRAAVKLHGALAGGARLTVVLLAAVVFLAQVGGVVWLASQRPTLGAVALLSAVPAFGLVAFVWKQDIVDKEPLDTLAITFVLSVLFASFAATINTLFQSTFQSIPLIGMALFFFVVVAPAEETVKWLAVRLHAYRRPEFDAVIDGAVYGAVAGLGFATIENTLYVVQGFLRAQEAGGTQAIGAALGTATSRALAGPGHVIYSAWAGYYLGLAKFNRENRGPIVVKGLLIAALIHGSYNVVVTYAPLGLLPGWGYLGFVVLFDGLFFYLLYRKLARYRDTYADTVGDGAGDDGRNTEGDGTVGTQRDPGAAPERGALEHEAEDGPGIDEESGAEESGPAGAEDDADTEAAERSTDSDSGAVWDDPDR